MSDQSRGSQRQQLLGFYHNALVRVNGRRVVGEYLEANPLTGDWAVVAIGKAASAMAEGAKQALAGHLQTGLLITRHGYADPHRENSTWKIMESGHPLPDAASLQAGEALLQFLDNLPDELPLLFLLSGGASALVEALPEEMSLDELVRVNNWLLASGLEIGQMNAVRHHLSRIKGGRLAHHLRGRRCLQLLLSDVPGDNPAVIGSAPLYPVTDPPLPDNLPEWLMALLQQGEPIPHADDPLFAEIETHVVANNGIALQAIKEMAQAQGIPVYLHPDHFHGSVQELAKGLVQTLLKGPPGLYLWGGESSMTLPALHGHGGRSQHLALAAAKMLARHDNILLLAAGTDGSDGPGEVAGALVDGETLQRGEAEGFSCAMALANADSGTFLAASGDLIETGPTGSNVMDLVLGWKLESRG
jgi:glycerate 2-kinase